MLKSNKWLITIDLDGTLLKTGTHGKENYEIHPKNLEIIKKLKELGHEVAIVTGRPWKDTKNVYEKLGLDGVVANYNGAHIHHPGNKSFVDLVFSMNKKILFEVLSEDIVKNCSIAYVVETLDKSYVHGEKAEFYLNIVNNQKRTDVEKWELGTDIPMNPQSSFVGIDFEKQDPYEILQVLKRRYRDSMFFRLWDGRNNKDGEPFCLLEINQIGSNKGTAMKYIASYYNIPITNTIAFGDGLNDREMLLAAANGVAMKNAKGTIQTYSDDTTFETNDEGGVGSYLKHFFQL